MLKPCPFCGSRSIKLYQKIQESESEIDKFEYGNYYIRCTKCKARGPLNCTEEKAASVWNMRAKIAVEHILSNEEFDIVKKSRDIMNKFIEKQ